MVKESIIFTSACCGEINFKNNLVGTIFVEVCRSIEKGILLQCAIYKRIARLETRAMALMLVITHGLRVSSFMSWLEVASSLKSKRGKKQ